MQSNAYPQRAQFNSHEFNALALLIAVSWTGLLADRQELADTLSVAIY